MDSYGVCRNNMDKNCKKQKQTASTIGGLHPTLDKHSLNDDDDEIYHQQLYS